MAKEVIKRGGKRQKFSKVKLVRSIRGVCRDVHLSAKRTKTVTGKVSRPVLKFAAKRRAVKTSVLTKKILSQLARVEPAAVKAWRKYGKPRRNRRRRR